MSYDSECIWSMNPRVVSSVERKVTVWPSSQKPYVSRCDSALLPAP
jgi:hypothetical protein